MMKQITPECSDCIKELAKKLLCLDETTDLSDFTVDNSLIAKHTDKMFLDVSVESKDYMEVLNHLQEDGKAVAMAMNSFTFDGRSSNIRKSLVESQLIESVILLPSKLLDGTMISATLLVFSRNNSSVMFVNATDVYHEQSRLMNILTSEDITAICEMCKTVGKNSVKVDTNQVIDNVYDLSPCSYCNLQQELEHGVSLECVSKHILCGLQLRPDVIKESTSDEPTEYKYLTPKNIGNSAVDAVLPYFKSIKESYLNHALHGCNLIITGIGRTPKLGILRVPEGETVIAVGRLFAFELDETKVDPMEVLAYLVGKEGTDAILRCNRGVTIGALDLKSLKKVLVPEK